MNPHVFVVMPFGRKEARAAMPAKDGNPAQPALIVDFDDIYKLLVAPALTEAECIPFRADNEAAAGDIRVDMFFELVTADVVLADISVLNPNVYYELGVRHAVGPRGLLMIHAGWSNAPFDIAPDRRFGYAGALFEVPPAQRDDAWREQMTAEAKRLGTVLRAALDTDEQTTGSPVYSSLPGLRPVDWTGVQTARSKYFGTVFADWKERVELAKREGWPGDILTLADDAPTRFHHGQLLWEAASALMSLRRFAIAKTVLEELVAAEPDHVKAQTQLGLALGRLGKMNEAAVHMEGVAARYAGDTEAQGILARVYKDLWRIEWKDLATTAERQEVAVTASSFIVSAIRSYDLAVRKHADYYNGINVVSFLTLLGHLTAVTGKASADCAIADLATLVEVVRFGASNALAAADRDGRAEDAVWARATLGELELVAGSGPRAEQYYQQAAVGPRTTYFQVSSMLDQINLFASLEFRQDVVAQIKSKLEARLATLAARVDRSRAVSTTERKVVVFSGHMIDRPGRATERFPARKEGVVRDRIAQQLETWNVAPGDLAICGGACGGDILFAEACAQRGAEVWLFLALAEGDFLEESVRPPGGDWEDRFYNLRDLPAVKTFEQPDRLKAPPKSASPLARNNLWMLNTARVEANEPRNLRAMLVWDEQPTGDGPGGTSDFAARVRRAGGRLAPIINPTKL